MKKDHRENTVGPWAKKKLDALEAYLKFYCKALSKQPFTRVYIDAFAGSCVAKVRGSIVTTDSGLFLMNLMTLKHKPSLFLDPLFVR